MASQIRCLVFAAFLLSFVGACDREKASPGATSGTTSTPSAAEDAASLVGRPFGPDALGFIRWLERDGAFVVMQVFDRDTNGDGQITAQFGDHGEPEGDLPTPILVDLQTNEAEKWDEVVATSPLGRWVVLRRGQELFAVSARKRWALEGADVSEPADPCTPSRKASIEPSGHWVTFVKQEPTRVVVKSLDSGDEREYAVENPLFRADPTPRGWIVTRELVDDTDGNGKLELPRQQGSCVCDWCSRFARSISSGRVAGDQPQTFLIAPDGERLTDFRSPIPVSRQAIWELSKNELLSPSGETVEFGGQGRCGLLAMPLGTEKMVIRCGEDVSIWDPSTNEGIAVEGKIDAVELFVPARDDWVAVRVAEDDGSYRLGRLNIEDGRVERGPVAVTVGASHPSGWVLGSDGNQLVTFDVKTGESKAIDQKVERISGLAAKVKDGWIVVDPSQGRVSSLPQRPAFIAANGCYIEPHPMNRPFQGPFQFICF